MCSLYFNQTLSERYHCKKTQPLWCSESAKSPSHLHKSLNVIAENDELWYADSYSQNFSLTQEIVPRKAVHMGLFC